MKSIACAAAVVAFTVFGKVLQGMEVVDRIQISDILRKAYLKE